jgi:hypothetical protein
MLHRLLDEVTVIPNIIADGYRLLQGVIEGKELMDPGIMLLNILDLIDRLWKADSQLLRFSKSLEEDTLGPVYWPVLTSESQVVEPDHLGKVFPVSFRFLDMRACHICLLYWATTAILNSSLGYTYKLLAGVSATNDDCSTANESLHKNAANFDGSQLPPLGHRIEVAISARNICQSLEFCLEDEHRDLGARAAVFPLKVAIETLNDTPGCERELLWAQASMLRVNGTGVRIMNHRPEPMTNHAILPG